MRSKEDRKKITYILRYASHTSKWAQGGEAFARWSAHKATFRWNNSRVSRWCMSCGDHIPPNTLHWRGASTSSEALCTKPGCGGK